MDTDIVVETCCHHGCGVSFGMTKGFKDQRLKDKLLWYCPNGHSQSYVGESDAAKASRLASERDSARVQRDEARAEKWKLERKVRELRKLLPPNPPVKKPAKKSAKARKR